MRSEELKVIMTINSSLSERSERSLLTPHSVAAGGSGHSSLLTLIKSFSAVRSTPSSFSST